jgi:hypothetical protein
LKLFLHFCLIPLRSSQHGGGWGAKVHDTRLIAIMQAHGLNHLLTFNTTDFKRFENVVTLHPASLPMQES